MVRRFWLVVAFFSLLTASYAQRSALTRPFKYLRPTLETDDAFDTRKSPYLWTVFIDREGVQVYKDKNLRNVKEDQSVGFMDRFIVADENDNSLLLYTDPNIDSTTFSNDALEIGWVPKNNLVLWERFLWGNQLTRLLAVSAWNKINSRSATILPNQFLELPYDDARYYIFNVVKVDANTNEVLISLRTFNHRSKGLFSWVRMEDLMMIHDRNGYIPNREMILDFGAKNPTVYESPRGAITKDLNEIAFYIDSLRADEGFFDIEQDASTDIKHVRWVDEGDFQEGYIEYKRSDYDQGNFKKGILVNRQEFSIMKKVVETLLESRTKEEYKAKWKYLFEDNNMSFYEEMGQYDLFEEITQMKFNYQPLSDGSTVDEIAFMSDQKFEAMKQELEYVLLDFIRAESDSDYPYNFAPFSYPHYWMPLDILPLNLFEIEFNETLGAEVDAVVDDWQFESQEKSYETFDLFYIDNSHDYNDSFDLKDQVIKNFYRRAARIRGSDPMRGSMIYYSNVRNPAIGSGEKFTEDVAGMMRESVASRPNRRIDKKLIRSNLYAKNIVSVENLRIHFYLGDDFYNEAFQSNRWLLKELATELHIEFAAESTQVILYKLGAIEDREVFVEQINANAIDGLSYRISIIE
jgi:hypothetical protein